MGSVAVVVDVSLDVDRFIVRCEFILSGGREGGREGGEGES